MSQVVCYAIEQNHDRLDPERLVYIYFFKTTETNLDNMPVLVDAMVIGETDDLFVIGKKYDCTFFLNPNS